MARKRKFTIPGRVREGSRNPLNRREPNMAAGRRGGRETIGDFTEKDHFFVPTDQRKDDSTRYVLTTGRSTRADTVRERATDIEVAVRNKREGPAERRASRKKPAAKK